MSISMTVAIAAFIVLLLIGFPIVFGIGLVSVLYLILSGNIDFLYIIPYKVYHGMNSFVIMAIPLFIMVGELMNRGRILDSLMELANVLVGRFEGGLAYVNVLASTFFAGISGSGLADMTGLGSIEIPMMEKNGYDTKFAAAVTAASGIQGPLIPPSIDLVIAAAVTQTSVGANLLGGAIPGLLVGLGCCLVVFVVTKRRKYPTHKTKYTFSQIVMIVKDSALAMFTPIILLGGLVFGIFTPTEAAAVAVLYCLLIGLFIFKTLNLEEIKIVLKNTIINSCKIYLLIGFASAFAWLLSMEGLPEILSNWIIRASFGNKNLMLIYLNLILLFWGMWMTSTSAILILSPIFLPIFMKVGVHPIHFVIIMVVNLMIGMLTPPFGLGLFAVQAISKEPLINIIKEIIPFIAVDIAIIFIITFIPDLALFLPRLFGFI